MKTKQQKTNNGAAKALPESILREQIEKRAYDLWLLGGGRHGDDLTHWFQAETEALAERRQSRAQQSSAIV